MQHWVADTVPSERFPVYSRANGGEVMPAPATPLTSSFVMMKHLNRGVAATYVAMGVADESEFDSDRPSHMGIFGGYLYLNISWARIIGVRGPGLDPEIIDQQYFGDLPGILPYAAEARPTDESPAHTDRIGQFFQRILAADDLPEYRQAQQQVDDLRASRRDLTACSAAELVALIRGLEPRFQSTFSDHAYTTAAGAIPLGALAATCAAVDKPELATALVGVPGDIDSAGPARELWKLSRQAASSATLKAEFNRGVDGLADRLGNSPDPEVRTFWSAFRSFQHQYGFRGPGEWELASPTWDTSPELPLTAIDRMRLASNDQSPEGRAAQARERAGQAREEIRSLLGADPAASAAFDATVTSALAWSIARERTKTTVVMFLHECRRIIRELGRRGVAAGAMDDPTLVFMLLDSELEAFAADPLQFKTTLVDRAVHHRGLADFDPPFVLTTDQIGKITFPRREERRDPVAPGSVLTGIPGSAGIVQGRARVVLDPADPRGLEPGDILVAPVTDPSWTPLFVPAAAVVVDVGAQISHAVIVAREIGIPAVVSVTGATLRIPDGALLTVDGDRGTVTVH